MLAFMSAFALGAIVVISCLFIYMTGFTAGEKIQVEKEKIIIRKPISMYANPAPSLYTAKGRMRLLNRNQPPADRYDVERTRLMDEALSTGIHWDTSKQIFVKTGRVYKLY
jgi:hypothetical protein